MALVRALCGMATSTRVIPAGSHIDDSDPVVKSNPQYFEPLVPVAVRDESVVEQATAEPGEKRTTRSRTAKS